ncbi:MAG: helix-turn-helix transcriptional regulator [Lawsonibacter sp.]|nr:helix-turn-helix transcriptional regulator [Lawsonibacter sp.]
MNPAYYEIYRTIGLNIAYYRNLRGMSQGALGDKLDIDQSHVSKIERAAVGVSIDLLCDIAAKLRVAPYQLLKPLE